MSEGLSANEREEQRLAKALNRVKMPARSSSSPSLSRAPSKPATFQELRRAQQPAAAAAPQQQERKVTEGTRQVLQRSASPMAREVTRAVPAATAPVRVAPLVAQRSHAPPASVASVSKSEYELSDAQLEARCMQWLEKVEPLLGGETFEFELGEEMRKSPRVVKG